MNKSTRTIIAAAAIAGLYAGALALKASASTNVNAGTQIVGEEKGKDSCKGKDNKDSSKGKEGDKSKDSCKAKDGCKAKDDKKDDKKSEPAK